MRVLQAVNKIPTCKKGNTFLFLVTVSVNVEHLSHGLTLLHVCEFGKDKKKKINRIQTDDNSYSVHLNSHGLTLYMSLRHDLCR